MAGARRPPHPALAPYVEPYVGYAHVLDPDVVHHGVPAASATVILAFDEPLDVQWLDDPASRAEHWTLASGLHLGPALVHTHGRQHGIQLALTPLGVRTLLGLPVGAIVRDMVRHDDLPGGVPEPLLARLSACPDWDSRFDLLDEHLLGLLRRARDPRDAVPPEVTEAWRLLRATRGRCRVDDLARRVGWSRRHLAERFAAEHGIGPKQAARLVRFEHARTLVLAGVRLSEVAARTGYADQAHLARDWRVLAGQPVTAMLAEQLPFLQDSGGPVGAGSVA
jgi:AraC-like DNA-binding protein